jgi:hypothetical protein
MSLGTTQDFCINYFASSHLDQGWSTKKDLCLIFDEDTIVGESWVVRSTCCRSAKDDCTTELTEDFGAGEEDLELLGEEESCLDEIWSIAILCSLHNTQW